MNDVRAKANLDRLYAELPKIDCQRKCESSCGPIQMSRVEWQRIVKKLGYEPHKKFDPSRPDGLDCPMLVGGMCSVYSVRPAICRLWGIVETLACPWGCKPERYLTHREGLVFLARVEEAGTPEHAEEARRMRDLLLAASDETLDLSASLIPKPVVE